MANKRQQASAPIFNRSKRPRLALATHPANTTPSQPQQKQRSYEKPSYNSQPWTNYPAQSSYTQNTSFSHPFASNPGGTSYQHPPAPYSHNHSTSYPSLDYQVQPRPAPTNYRSNQPRGQPPSHKHQQPKYYQTTITSYQQNTNTTGYNQQDTNIQGCQTQLVEKLFPVYPKQPEMNPLARFERYPQNQSGPPPTHEHSARSISRSTPTPAAVGQIAHGQPVEPSKKHVAQTGGSATKETKPRPTLRLLTATAQGMKHWATYKAHTPLLFEIYGSVTNGGVQSVGCVCKQFTLQTSDGPVTCQYWEVDNPLPLLCVGGAYRVIGQWDGKTSVLKCFSMRCVRPGECEGLRVCVEASDKAMRKFVGKIHKTNC